LTRIAIVCTCLAPEAIALDLELDRAELRIGDATLPPPADATGWQSVSLPDRWTERRPEVAGVGWYRIAFELESVPEQPLAVYLEHVSMNASVWANGSWIGQEGRMEPPVSQSWNRPLYFALPRGLLHPGTNLLEVRLHRLADCYGGLGPIRVGDAEALSILYARNHFWRVEVARASTVVSLLFALIMLAFWAGSRDAAYAAFASVCALLAVNDMNFHVRDIPLSSGHWEALVCNAALLSAAAFWVFAQRFAGHGRTVRERWLLVYAAIGLTLFVVSHGLFHPLFNALSVVAVGLSLHAALVIERHARREDPPIAAVYAGLAVLILGILGHDLGVQLGWIAQPALLLYPWIGSLLVLGFGAGLTRRFVRAFREAEGQRDLLARRIEEKRVELEERSFELRALEHDRLIGLERERIMREMHDGVGGHLVRTLSMLEGREADRGELADALREALDDMRIVIDSLDPSADDLAIRLGMLRTRLERSLARSGVMLAWRLDPLVPEPILGAEASLHVLRIVQEAVTNAVRHASATTLTVAMRSHAGPGGVPGIVIEVSDDGIGWKPARPTGRGTANMRRRAELIGATLEIGARDAAPGTRVALFIPFG
jgi:signal transduction histidine kinase